MNKRTRPPPTTAQTPPDTPEARIWISVIRSWRRGCQGDDPNYSRSTTAVGALLLSELGGKNAVTNRALNLTLGGLVAGTLALVGFVLLSHSYGVGTVLSWIAAITFFALVVRYRASLVRLVSDWSRRRVEARARQKAEEADRIHRMEADARNAEIREMQRFSDPRQMLTMRDDEFEEFVLRYFRLCGYETEHTGKTGDHGVDGILRARGKTWLVQCKCYRPPNGVGEPEVRDFLGAITKHRAESGLFVTTSTFAGSAYRFAHGEPIRLVDGDEFSRMISALQVADSLSTASPIPVARGVRQP